MSRQRKPSKRCGSICCAESGTLVAAQSTAKIEESALLAVFPENCMRIRSIPRHLDEEAREYTPRMLRQVRESASGSGRGGLGSADCRYHQTE